MNKFHLGYIRIQNFKSILDCEIHNCKRINLFIGRPNVGKSNIIEALSLFSVPYLKENAIKKLTSLVRLENEAELFYKGNYERSASITVNQYTYKVVYKPKEEGLNIITEKNLDILIYGGNSPIYRIDSKLNVKADYNDPDILPIRRYSFNPNIKYKHSHSKYLIPPYGFNLMDIVEGYEDLKVEVIDLFKEYNLDIAFDTASQTIKIIQSKSNGDIFLIPYNSIADTLQRLIFFKAAIASNNNSVLLFEEPEAHSFPPYMSKLTQDMIHKKDNQFFIATHSPYIVNDLLENAQDELSIYMVDYVDKQTIVKQLTQLQLHDIQQYGVDLFTNSESFI